MTTFNWKDENTKFIRGCLCGDKNNCAGCATYEEHKGSIYPKPVTNYDRLISKTPEEMAEWLCDIAGWLPEYEGRMHPILEWLKQEAKE